MSVDLKSEVLIWLLVKDEKQRDAAAATAEHQLLEMQQHSICGKCEAV